MKNEKRDIQFTTIFIVAILYCTLFLPLEKQGVNIILFSVLPILFAALFLEIQQALIIGIFLIFYNIITIGYISNFNLSEMFSLKSNLIHGAILIIIFVLKEFTQRKKTGESFVEKKYEENQNTVFKHLIDLLPEPAIIIDENNIIQFTNQEFKNLSENSSFVEGQLINEFLILPEFESYLLEFIQQIRDSNQKHQLDFNRNMQKFFKSDFNIIGSPLKFDQNHFGILLILHDISEYFMSQEKILQYVDEIQTQKDHFQNLIQHNPLAIVLVSIAGTIKLCNESFKSLYGYTEKEIINKNIDELIVPFSEQEKADKFAKAAIERQQNYLQGKRKTSSGDLIDVEISTMPVDNNDGTFDILVIYHDITEKEKVTQQMSEQLNFLTSFISSVPNPLVVISSSGEFIHMNYYFAYEIMNSSIEGITGKNFRDFLNMKNMKNLIETMQDNFLKVDKTGFVTFDLKIPWYDESIKRFRLNMSSYVNNLGEIAGYIIIFSDLTELFLTREQLNLQAMAMEHADINIALTNNSGIIEWVNDAFERITGYPGNEVIGERLNVFKSNLSNDIFLQLLRGNPWQGRFQNMRLDGTYYPEEILITPFQSSDETITHFIVISKDISLQIEAEQKLHDAKQAAENIVFEKADFLAKMSHEIRTPLNAIVGMSSLLDGTNLDTEQDDYVKLIQSSSENLLVIVNDSLDYSKIEAGKMLLEEMPFFLYECIESAIDLIANIAQNKGIEIGYTINQDTPAVILGDITRMRQILVNLFSNAVKFTEKGEIILSVQSEELPNQKYKYTISVKDTGIGISEEGIKNLFKLFSQVDPSTARRFGGTGLGLAISQQLVTMMDGNIWVESETGIGTTFYFTIITKAQKSTLPYLQNQDVLIHKKRIFLWSDTPSSLELLSKQMMFWSVEVDSYKNIKELNKNINTMSNYDLLIFDMHEQNTQIMDFIRKVKDLQAKSKVPTLLVKHMKSNIQSNKENELFDSIIVKPIKQAQLYKTIIRFWRKDDNNVVKKEEANKFDKNYAIKKPMSILFVDDNVMNQKVAETILRKFGYEIDIVGNGKIALDYISKKSYDVVFMDIQMPEMDGEAATLKIREQFENPEIPWIIAQTANALKGDREYYLAAKMNDYISKPIKVENLMEVIDKAYIAKMKNKTK